MMLYKQDIETLKRLMNQGYIVTITFTKKDGTKRTVNAATTSPYLISTDKHAKDSGKVVPDYQARFYSIDDSGWRSFDSNLEFSFDLNWEETGSCIIYTKDNCRYCTAAKELLNDLKLSYRELKIGDDISREFIQEKWPDHKTAPVVLLPDGTLIGGFNELEKALMDGSSCY